MQQTSAQGCSSRSRGLGLQQHGCFKAALPRRVACRAAAPAKVLLRLVHADSTSRTSSCLHSPTTPCIHTHVVAAQQLATAAAALAGWPLGSEAVAVEIAYCSYCFHTLQAHMVLSRWLASAVRLWPISQGAGQPALCTCASRLGNPRGHTLACSSAGHVLHTLHFQLRHASAVAAAPRLLSFLVVQVHLPPGATVTAP